MKKKKLLVIHPALAPYRVDFFNSLHEYFDAKFYFFNENLLNQKFDQNTLKKNINFQCFYLKKGINFKGRSIRFSTGKIIKQFQPDIVLVPEYNLISLSVLKNRLLSKKKYKIVTICDDSIHVAEKTPSFKRIFRSFLLKKLDAVILTHKEIENWYTKKLEPRAKLLTFPIIRKEAPFIKQIKDSESITKDYKGNFKIENKKVLLFVGRLVEVKNLERLIDAFKIVTEKKENILLIIVGSGKLEKKLKEKIKDLRLSKSIILPGRFEGKSLLAWYRLSDLFILPSKFEPFGAVINEALLSGCFTLCSNLAGGVCLIEDGENGNTFNPYNISEMADVISSAFDRVETSLNIEPEPKNYMLTSYNETLKVLIENLYAL